MREGARKAKEKERENGGKGAQDEGEQVDVLDSPQGPMVRFSLQIYK